MIFAIFDMLQNVSLFVYSSFHSSFLSTQRRQDANGANKTTPAIFKYLEAKSIVGPLPNE